jgi:hypothetical protein
VRDTIRAQLDTAGRFRPEVNAAYAALVGNAYQAFASRMGTTAEALYQRFPLKVFDAAQGGESLEQALASQPPKGWEHVSDGEGIAAFWENAGERQAVFMTDLQGKLAQDKPELAGYSHSLDRYAVNHIRKEHGNEKTEAARGQAAITARDIASIPAIITDYDAVRQITDWRGRPQAAYAKRIGDRVLVYIEEISGQRKNMRGASMRGYLTASDAETILNRVVRDELNVRNERSIPAQNSNDNAQALSLEESIAESGGEYNNPTSEYTNQGYIDGEPYTPNVEPLNAEEKALVLKAFNDENDKPVKSVYQIEESSDITRKSLAFQALAQREGYTVHPELRGKKYFTIEKGDISIHVRVSDHSNVNRGYHFKETEINLAPDDGYAFDTFDSALWKLRNASVDENDHLLFGGQEAVLFQSAYHGSPHRFSEFSTDFMGDGEGAQVHGWGIYVLRGESEDRKDHADSQYRNRLAQGRATFKADWLNSGAIVEEDGGGWSVRTEDRYNDDYNLYDAGEDGEKVIAALELVKDLGKEQAIVEVEWARDVGVDDDGLEEGSARILEGFEQNEDGTLTAELAEELIDNINALERAEEGNVYRVEIPDDDVLLDEDLTFDEQPEKVRVALAKELELSNVEDYDEDWDAWDHGGRNPDGARFEEFDRGKEIYEAFVKAYGGKEEASKRLNELGIKGIAYVGRDDGEAAVIFDDEAIKIMERYYQNQQDRNRGAFNPATLSIALLKDADLSTFLHESGHFFLEMQTAIVGDLLRESAAFGVENLNDAEQRMLADTQTLMNWFGLRDLNEWSALPFEERRFYHEQFARGFEAYLYEGKAPSLEMQGLFQRFRQFLIRVYQSIKALNVELSDDVRGVFERMLATDEQIALTEQARSLLPLFENLQRSGMSAEEFADYQATGEQATADAQDYLGSRAARDMRFIANARGREVKRLKKLAQALRAEATIEARREIMSQPVYRAWAFLTGEITPEDALPKTPRRKSDPHTLDETQDSLFTAIAKLGGLDRDAVTRFCGLEKEERPQSGVFGKPVLRRQGGLSPDAMGQELAQYGYLTLDEDGRYDLRELEEKFYAQLNGDEQYSSAYDIAAAEEEQLSPVERLANAGAVQASRLDLRALKNMYYPEEILNLLTERKMTAQEGFPPDMAAEMLGDFDSGDAMIQALVAAIPPKQAITERADQIMLERHGELSSPEAITDAADAAVFNAARGRMVATEASALAKALGKRGVLLAAAREFAMNSINRIRVRDVQPGQYLRAQARAAKAALKAEKAGDIATAAAEKRNQLAQVELARAAQEAKEYVATQLRFLRRMAGDVKGIDVEYKDQIHQLLERYELREISNKEADRRTSLAAWLEEQEKEGKSPEIPPELVERVGRISAA